MYEDKGYSVEFKILNKESFNSALLDKESQFIYTLSHGAENAPALKAMAKGQFIEPSDVPEGHNNPVVRAAACHQGSEVHHF